MEPTPRGTCCERCRNNMGGGMTMLPLVRGCANLDCSCHTAPPTEPLIPLDVIERIGTIDDTPTPNTGTEWEEKFDEKFGLYNELDCKPFIRSLLATQKSQIIAEVEGMKYPERQYDDDRHRSHNAALDAVITKLKGV